jgi:hypothetical protein
VGGDKAASREAARPDKPDLADEQVVKEIRFGLKNQRDCGAASAVGGATVAISLLVAAGNVSLAAFNVLLFAQALLLFLATMFYNSSARLMGREPSRFLLGLLMSAATAVAAAGSFLSSVLKQQGSNAGSSAWWWLLVLAGGGALLGLIIRRSAESLLDELDDEIWKQRLAPLVTDSNRQARR